MAKKQSPYLVPGLIVVALVLGGAYMGYIDLPFAVSGTETTVTPGDGVAPESIVCTSNTTPTVTYNVFDETPGNEAASLSSDYNCNYYRNGVFASEATCGGTFDASPGDQITVYAEDIDTTHDVYGFSDAFVVGCQEVVTKSVNKGMQDGAISLTIYDVSSGTDTANAIGSETAIGAGGTIDSKINLRETTRNARWGTSEGGVRHLVVFDYNSDGTKQPEIVSLSEGSYSAASVPIGHKSTDVNSALDSSVAYEITSDVLKDIGAVEIFWQAEASGATVNPPVLAGVGNTVAITVYDLEMYQKDNGTWVTDYRDADDGSNLGETNGTDQFHFS